jgi:hypothetical protein
MKGRKEMKMVVGNTLTFLEGGKGKGRKGG